MEETTRKDEDVFQGGWVYGCKHPLFYDPSRARGRGEFSGIEVEDEHARFPRSLWYYVVWLMTFYLVGPVLRLFGKNERRVQEAFREKVALCKLNFIAMFVIGFIIFGLNDVCCKNVGVQIVYSKLSKSNYFSIHGILYDVEEGVAALGDIGIKTTKQDVIGRDLSSLFTISDECSGLSEDEDDVSGKFRCNIRGVTPGCRDVSVLSNLKPAGEVFIGIKSIVPNNPFVIYGGVVLDLRLWEENRDLVGRELYSIAKKNAGRDITRVIQSKKRFINRVKCITNALQIASIDKKSAGCVFSQGIVMVSFIFIIGTVGTRFVIAVYFHFLHTFSYACCSVRRESRGNKVGKRPVYQFDENINRHPTPVNARATTLLPDEINEPITRPHVANITDASSPSTLVLILIPCYSEYEEGIRDTLDTLSESHYPADQMCIVIVSDGIVQGSDNDQPTPDYIKNMMIHDERFFPDSSYNPIMEPVESASWPKAYSYIAIANGVYKNNNARVYSGWYESKKIVGRRIPMLLVAKVGNDIERAESSQYSHKSRRKMPGNRGKRDSQVLLLSFLSKILFDDRMTELEIDIFHKMWVVTNHHPGNYEALLMLDADTIVYPDALPNLVATLENDKRIMGVCGETKILCPWKNLVTMIQVYEYYLSHHLSKAFESFFGNVTCLPGCFSMYRIKCPKNGVWVPILTNPDILEKYSENIVETLHQKNLLLLGEDRYLTTLLLKTFPKRHNVFVPSATCRTNVPDSISVLLSQRRRWVNSTIHNLMELILIRDLCGIFCFSMQFMVAMELIGSITLPAATGFTLYLIINSSLSDSPEVLPLILLAAILGLPVILMLITIKRTKYVIWFFFYLIALPFWQIVIPLYAFWHFDNFTWGETRKVIGNNAGGLDHSRSDGVFDHSNISLKRWSEWLRDRIAKTEMQNLNTSNIFESSPRGLAMNKSQSCSYNSSSNTLYQKAVRSDCDDTLERVYTQDTLNDALLLKFMQTYSNHHRVI